MNTNEDPPRASLLGLSGEIRNRSCHEFPVELTLISFHSFGPGDTTKDLSILNKDKAIEPGFLRCCSLIRWEARPIFCNENCFEMYIQDGRLGPQLNHWFWVHVPGKLTSRTVDHAGYIV